MSITPSTGQAERNEPLKFAESCGCSYTWTAKPIPPIPVGIRQTAINLVIDRCPMHEAAGAMLSLLKIVDPLVIRSGSIMLAGMVKDCITKASKPAETGK